MKKNKTRALLGLKEGGGWGGKKAGKKNFFLTLEC